MNFINWINADKMITIRLRRTLPVYLMICAAASSAISKMYTINVRTYTAQEAITLIGALGHWGPWN